MDSGGRSKTAELLLQKGLADFYRQFVYEKWFLNKFHPLFEHAVMSDNIGRIAGHVKDFKIGPADEQLRCQVTAVHLRHDHVGHEQVNFSVIFFGKHQGLCKYRGYLTNIIRMDKFQKRFTNQGLWVITQQLRDAPIYL